MKQFARLVIPFSIILMAGCGPVSDDPREGGLRGYWHGTSSGAYERRQQQRRDQLEQERQTSQQLNQRALALEEERELQNQTLRKEQRYVRGLEKKLSDLKTKVHTLRLTSDQQKREAADLLARIDATKQRLDEQDKAIAALDGQSRGSLDPDRARVLELERDRLAEEYRKLTSYYQALSNALH